MTDETLRKLRQSIKAILFWVALAVATLLMANYPLAVGLALVALIILGTIISPWIAAPEPKGEREPMRGVDRFAGRDGF